MHAAVARTETATDAGTGTITGTSNTIAVGAAAATHFSVSAPSSATAGSAFNVTVTALDQFNNTATTYAGTVHFTSSDGAATLPANSTLTSGTGTFSATLKTAGGQSITATDTASSSVTGTSNTITVGAAAATHFAVSAPASATAGSAFSFTVTAQDQFNNTATGYTGTVHFTSTDGNATLPANSTLTSGTGTFSATLTTAGSQTITATDTASSSITGTSGAIAVSAAAATHFAVSAPTFATTGTAFSFTVTAQDQFNNTATGYTGTVHFTSSDGAATLPADGTLTNGTGTFSATLNTSGGQTITATDTVSSSITGTSNSITVTGPATHFTVTAPSTVTAGSAFTFTVTALDTSNNTAGAYSGTVHFTSSDGQPVLPANVTLTNGTGTFSATLKTAGGQTITATDTASSAVTGTSNTITVSAAAATHFAVTTPNTATAGVAFTITVTALDDFGNTATGYTGTAHFTSTDGQATLPANSTLTNGTGNFSATLTTAGNQTITATDTTTSSITGTSAVIAVSAAAATHFAVNAPSSATAGSAFTITVTAQDQFNNTATGYTGTVHFTSSDSGATLPANSTLTNGAGTFSATLTTAGSQTITATDTATTSITGTSNAISVSAAAATHFAVSAPGAATAGSAFTVTVTAQDQFNNTATGYTGTVHFTSTDGQATLPANSTLTNGAGTFSATLKTAGSQTITATDTAASSVTGASNSIAVSPAGVHHFAVNAPSSATAGTAVLFTVTAQDQFNNTVTGYTGTVHFTSTDTTATLPADAALTNGSAGFSATLRKAGSQTLTASDLANASVTGTSAAIAVSAAAATHFTVNAPATATTGAAFSVTVTAQDQFNNTATGYTGTVHFTSTDGAATLPADGTLTGGVGTFSATLKTLGSQTLTATDTATSSITGTSAAIAVSAPTATHFTVSAPSAATAGAAFTFTVTALDANNNAVPGYTGTVHFTSSDAAATLPGDVTLTNGVGTFSATLKTAGTRTITATDTANSSLTGASNPISVSAAPAVATHFAVSAPATATAGKAFTFTVTALDANNNTVAGYTGTVHFTSTDGAAGLPIDATLTNGVGTFSATLNTAGSQTVTATDAANNLSGSSNPVAVSVAPATGAAERVGTFRGNGTWSLDNQDGAPFKAPPDVSFVFGLPGDTAVVGDWNGDGFTDVGTWRGIGGALFFSLDTNGNNVWDPSVDEGFFFGAAGDKVVVGDWDGDGKDTICVVRDDGKGGLLWSLDYSGDHSFRVYHFGLTGDQVVVGDWNGDGRTKVGTARSVVGFLAWSLDFNGDGEWDNSGVADRFYNFGASGDTAVVGDWNGDGRTDIGTYRLSGDGKGLIFSLDKTGNGQFSVAGGDVVGSFGLAGDRVIVGDWTGDGSQMLGTARPAASVTDLFFSLDRNGDALFTAADAPAFTFGFSNDQAVVGKWRR